MTEQTPVQAPCGCGRSPTGFCNGWHKLTNEQYQSKLNEQQKLNENRLLQE